MPPMNSSRTLSVFLVLLTVLTLSLGPAANVITDWQWYETLGQLDTFQRRLGVQVGLFLATSVLTFAILYGNAAWTVRNLGPHPELSSDLTRHPLGMILKRLGLGRVCLWLSLGMGLFVGLAASGWWPQVLLAWHGGSMGFEEPVFGMDAGFFVFKLPLIEQVRFLLMSLVMVGGLASLAIYVTHGAIQVKMVETDGRVQPEGINFLKGARQHVATLAAALMVFMAVGVYLRRFQLMSDQMGLFAGPGYADLHGTLPLLNVQAVATLIAAFLVHVGIDRSRKGLIGVGAAMAFGTGALTSMYPGVLQRFLVEPNEISTESPQINDHVKATRFAYQLDAIEERSLSGEGKLNWTDIENNHGTVNNVRLWDHDQLLATFAQVQEIRTYYRFLSVDNDRYNINGEFRQIMLSPREFSVYDLPDKARTWVNTHISYTHGYGVTLGPVNRVTPEGLPELFVKDLPPKVAFPDDLAIDEPGIYYGETQNGWVLTHTAISEFDYPIGEEFVYTTYEGTGGVELGQWGRYLFALRFGSTELLFSSDLDSNSRILMHRNIRKRVLTVAPFLVLDADPYLVIDQGRLVWMLDAYVTSNHFPYSRSTRTHGNYIRNAVKVSVDAFDGDVTLYLFESDEPIAKAWAAAFPELFEDADKMPGTLRDHLRYPQDLFAIQSNQFALYHMTDAQVFYNREDEWEVPRLGNDSARSVMEPYYTIMRLPGESEEEFILMRPLSPMNKPNLAAWMVARSDGEDYGKLRLYRFPKEKLIYGPNQIASRINQDTEISKEISLWNQQGSHADFGTMLVLPIEESLIYVQPLYLRSTGESIPELKRVVVAYENKIAMQPTLEESLAVLFAEDRATLRRQAATDQQNGISTGTETTESLIEYASKRYEAATEAQEEGDWATYGEELTALGETLQALQTQTEKSLASPDSDETERDEP
jgi:uncharacterized membrane protein (UPF0182 family)